MYTVVNFQSSLPGCVVVELPSVVVVSGSFVVPVVVPEVLVLSVVVSVGG